MNEAPFRRLRKKFLVEVNVYEMDVDASDVYRALKGKGISADVTLLESKAEAKR